MIAMTRSGIFTDDNGKAELIGILGQNLETFGLIYDVATRSRDHCIFSTRSLIAVLRAFGFNPRPIVSRVIVYNSVFWDLLNTTGKAPETETELQDVMKMGGYNMGIGVPDGTQKMGDVDLENGRWAGHLVTGFNIGERQYMIDLSLPQANRPNKSIETTPVCLDITGRDLPIAIQFEGGTVACYYFFPDEKTYENTPDWQTEDDRMDIAAINLIKGLVLPINALKKSSKVKIGPGGDLDVVCPHCGAVHSTPLPPGYLAGESTGDRHLIEICPATKNGYEIVYREYGKLQQVKSYAQTSPGFPGSSGRPRFDPGGKLGMGGRPLPKFSPGLGGQPQPETGNDNNISSFFGPGWQRPKNEP